MFADKRQQIFKSRPRKKNKWYALTLTVCSCEALLTVTHTAVYTQRRRATVVTHNKEIARVDRRGGC